MPQTDGPDIVAVILAAGASSRFGGAKHAVRLPDGRTMPRRMADEAASAGLRPLVVVGGHAAAVVAGLGDTPRVHNPDWELGLGTSIAAGVRHATGADAVLLVHADQVRLTAADLRRVADAMTPTGAAAAWYGGGPGVPACLARTHFPALLGLRSTGAKRLLLDLPDLVRVALPAAGQDVDTPADAVRLEGAGAYSG